MAPTTRILEINPGSDGDGRKWPKHHFTRNDEHYKELVATNYWIKDLPGGAEPNVIYFLNRLPNGYAGFEKVRPDGERTDYWLYGHPNGKFDSVKKFYTHFKHLMDFGGPTGCTCDLCMSGNGKKRSSGGAVVESRNESERDITPPQRSRFFPAQNQQKPMPAGLAPNLISPFTAKPRGRPRKHPIPEEQILAAPESKLVDAEGTPDIYETLIAKMKQGNREEIVDVPIEEKASPDWRSGNSLSKALFKQFHDMPRYVPRIGEIVLFVRRIDAAETIAWDANKQTFRRKNCESNQMLVQPKWEAGIVTQMPQESVSDQDLLLEQEKERGLNYFGFRVEPLSKPGSDTKPFTKQHKYVALHLIRPFTYWQECLQGVPEKEWHPSIWHALSVTSSFCVVGRYRFKGIWPNATVFCRGAYIGAELIMPGDVVRLSPRRYSPDSGKVTETMNVTAIRLRFVNLDVEDDDMAPESDLPYQICLHMSGRVYTTDPSKSFDGVGKGHVQCSRADLPHGLSEHETWYHRSDPANLTVRTELPFTRVLGRYFEDVATKAWFQCQRDSAKSTQKEPVGVKNDVTALSRGLKGSTAAREYSRKNDNRVDPEAGRSWFWADTRIEQLDLHEVNGRYVGARRERTAEEMRKWRTSIKALDGKKSALEQIKADKQAQVEKARQENQAGSNTYGMVAASRDAHTESPSATEADRVEDDEDEDENDDEEAEEDEDEEGIEVYHDAHDAMDVDEHFEPESVSEGAGGTHISPPESSPHKKLEVITLSDSEDEEERVTDQLAGELAKNIRANDSRPR